MSFGASASTALEAIFRTRRVRQFDYNAWIKLKYRRDYDSITPEDQLYYRPTPRANLARLIRRGWRKITFRQYRKGHRRARIRIGLARTSQGEQLWGFNFGCY